MSSRPTKPILEAAARNVAHALAAEQSGDAKRLAREIQAAQVNLGALKPTEIHVTAQASADRIGKGFWLMVVLWGVFLTAIYLMHGRGRMHEIELPSPSTQSIPSIESSGQQGEVE